MIGQPAAVHRLVETRTQRIWLRSDGIVQATNLGSRELRLPDVRENVAAVATVSRGVRRPLLVDSVRVAPLSRDAQAELTSSEAGLVLAAVGVVVGRSSTRTLANLAFVWQRTAVPMRLFDAEGDALLWAASFLEPVAPPAARPSFASIF